MSDNPLSSGWTNVDDDAPSVRVTDAKSAHEHAQTPVADVIHGTQPTLSKKKTKVSIAPNPGAMRLSAFSGIAVVLVLGVLYLGIDNLRGSLTEESTREAKILITEDGHFLPAAVTITAGGTLTIENTNADPQVVKVKEGNELFPVQVLFEKPYVFVVPTDASGIYTYVSETLPEGEQVEITVQPAIEAAAIMEDASTVESTPPIEEMNEFPLPFGGPVQTDPEPMQEVPEIAVDIPVNTDPAPVAHTEHDDTAEEISISAHEEVQTASFSSGEIPTNPFTVGSAGKNDGSRIATNAKTLHSGAPLLQLRSRPRANTSTGPQEWGVFVVAILLMTVVYRFGMTKFR